MDKSIRSLGFHEVVEGEEEHLGSNPQEDMMTPLLVVASSTTNWNATKFEESDLMNRGLSRFYHWIVPI